MKIKELGSENQSEFLREFVDRYLSTYQRLGLNRDMIPPAEEMIKIGERFIKMFGSLDWDRVRSVWDREVINYAPEIRYFNEPILYRWFNRMVVDERNQIEDAPPQPPPGYPTTPEGLLERMLPAMKEALENPGPLSDLQFVGPNFSRIWPHICGRLGEKLERVRATAAEEWIKKVFDLTGQSPFDGENLADFDKRLKARHGDEVPDENVIFRKLAVRELLK